MKKIILDHFRRWWWVMLLCIVFNIFFVLTNYTDKSRNALHQIFPFGMFMGVFLLAFDLQRGHARAMINLPITAWQLARSWWWVAVGIPVALITSITVLTFCFVSIWASNWDSLADCVVLCLSNCLMLGVMFFCLTGLPFGQQWFASNWTGKIRGWIFSGLWGLSFGGWYFFQTINLKTVTGAALLIVAVILTIVGWFRAETLVRERAKLQLAPPSSAKKESRPSNYLQGRGGLSFLVQTIFNRMMLTGLSMVGFFTLMLALMIEPKYKALNQQLKQLPAMAQLDLIAPPFLFNNFSFYFVFFTIFQIMTICSHLRFLRTQPVSTMKLTSVLIFIPLFASLVILCLDNLLMSALFHLPLASVVKVTAKNDILLLALGLLLVPIATWRVWSILSYSICIILMLLGVSSSFYVNAHFLFVPCVVISLSLIIVSFVATKLLLERNSRVYRPRGTNLFGWGWNWGR